MNHTVLCAAMAFLLVVILGITGDVRPPTVITRALVAGLGTACLTHMSGRWLQAQRVAFATQAARAKEAAKEAEPA